MAPGGMLRGKHCESFVASPKIRTWTTWTSDIILHRQVCTFCTMKHDSCVTNLACLHHAVWWAWQPWWAAVAWHWQARWVASLGTESCHGPTPATQHNWDAIAATHLHCAWFRSCVSTCFNIPNQSHGIWWFAENRL